MYCKLFTNYLNIIVPRDEKTMFILISMHISANGKQKCIRKKVSKKNASHRSHTVIRGYTLYRRREPPIYRII